jgi:hypothetical protein
VTTVRCDPLGEEGGVMLFDPIAVALALFVALALVAPAPRDWRRARGR